jgi:hypothetical protein
MVQVEVVGGTSVVGVVDIGGEDVVVLLQNVKAGRGSKLHLLLVLMAP